MTLSRIFFFIIFKLKYTFLLVNLYTHFKSEALYEVHFYQESVSAKKGVKAPLG